ncbi:MAG TPA: sensor domain-containing protein [Gaiellaceae bacterium]|jgi:signal transduction histidine kinase
MAERGRTLLFLLAAVPLGAAGFAVLIAGWVVVTCLAVTPLGVPALVAFRAAVGGASRLDAELANALLGTSGRPPVMSSRSGGFWRIPLDILSDGAFWRQQAYLLIRLSLGFAVAVAEWSLLVGSLGLVSLPIWYRWTDVQLVDGWRFRTLGHALLAVPVGIVGVVIALLLLRPIASAARYLVESLLGGGGDSVAQSEQERRRALEQHAMAYVALNLFLTIVWALTSRGYFWPEWTMIVFGLPVAIETWLVRPRSAIAQHAGISVALATFFTLVWAVTSRGYYWPVWPILALGIALLVHGVGTVTRRGERISVLETTRAGAVDQQESELERIERDLHDGAQARLVALGMSLGMAEQKLASDPAAAQELLAEARQGTREALEELRSLARGIHPPVLADRGLEAAIAAIANRTPVRVDVAVDVRRRPPKAVETAAYFVVAEALANAGKHANADHVAIDVHEDGGTLVAEVVDDGVGGANRNGGGLSGLARRVEALDGTLEVISPAGGPTTIRAVIPCES